MSFVSASSTADTHPSSTIAKLAPIGRFAPSPSGPLHFGSLISALASFLDIRAKGGQWLLRIDDLDTPRTRAGSEDAILATLAAHELNWDGPVSRQSEHLNAYHHALHKLATQRLLFYCNCSRKSLQGTAVYPGTCHSNLCSADDLTQHLQSEQHLRQAIRLRVPTLTIHCQDELQRDTRIELASGSGDYIVLRRDGLVSYQLAVVVDDALTGVTRVVRGADLLPTTPRQQHLHTALGSSPPVWLHLPVLLNDRQAKLSKQAHSLPVDDQHPSANIDIALQLLGQNPPSAAHAMPTAALIEWAIENWQPRKLPANETFSTFVGW